MKILTGILFLLTACAAHAQSIQLVNAFPNLQFNRPLFLTHSPDGSDRIFVVQEDGFIKVFPNDSAAGTAGVFLDLSSKISSSGGEEGLLGLAFDPDYARNGFFYVDYTARGPVAPTYLQTIIARFHVSPGNPDVADPSSEFDILHITQPFSNHNGGMLAFGPGDGDLYIGMGDGGSAYDPDSNGQNLHALLGKILRIDVRDTTATLHYRIPPDNPFAGNAAGYREEIWAYGLRNPFRFSFDSASARLWVGDVGQATREEVDIVERGKNYGWNVMEGFICTPPENSTPNTCDTAGMTLPVKDYNHSLGDAIIGGYVYRGYRQPSLVGDYVYGDNGSGRIWLLRYENGTRTLDTLLLQAPFNISSFGEDEHQELYVVSHSFSSVTSIYRFNGPGLQTTGVAQRSGSPADFALAQNYPNPFNPSTAISYQLSANSLVTLTVHDILGRHVATLVDSYEQAGAHTVTFNASGLASGVYFYRLYAGSESAQRTMLYLK